jgi:predicted RNA binding protein with dsRBD fold (UPF0201 family)
MDKLILPNLKNGEKGKNRCVVKMEKSLIIKLNNISDTLRVILKEGVQSSIISKAIKKSGSIKSLAEKLRVDRSTIYCWRIEKRFMEFKYLKKLMKILDINPNTILDKIRGVKGQSDCVVLFKKKLPFEVPVELIAHLQGDGSVKTRDCACNYTNQEPSLINSFIKEFQRIFATKIHIYKTEGYTQVTLPAAVGKILTSKFGTFSSKKFIVPKLKNRDRIRRYLRAIFDDEGSVVEDKKRYRYISIRLRNKTALQQIRNFLSKLGINTHLYDYKDELRISGLKNILLYEKEVGFTHSLQKEKLRKLLNNYKLKR